MKNTLDIKSQHLKIIQQILKKYLPPQTTVWVFGSRAKGTAKKFSDLDLAIDAGNPLSAEILADLANAFDESILPYKVDIVDWITLEGSFRENIRDDRITL